MIVECIINDINNLECSMTKTRIKKFIKLSDGKLVLKMKKKYSVYAIIFRDNAPWYFICDADYDIVPTAYPAEIFGVVDNSIPSSWNLHSMVDQSGVISTIFTFDEWGSEKSFFEKLVNDDPEVINIFETHKAIIDQRMIEIENQEKGTE